MCIFSAPKAQAAPVLPPEPAQTKAPDSGAVRSSTGRRTMDRARAGSDTILTSGLGVTETAATAKKTLLGQ
ncbi:MAG: hypothetical protein KYX69_19590 [Sphingomonas sp.]|uniref:hypothetical protein n=1 Tax=Sphingomonas sp. TaxID=28214 RepID=UPI00261C4F43|nr:hypothetical protein [Sphingomonas sp.]MDK2769907.1 hypothetical protein [Sphingomonas sp.]